jgi:hypothetical protein
MDASLKLKAEQLAGEIASQAQSLEDVNGLLRTLMKGALERMLDTEMDVHLGRKTLAALPPLRSFSSAFITIQSSSPRISRLSRFGSLLRCVEIVVEACPSS